MARMRGRRCGIREAESMHRLVIAPSAEADLNAIVDYIAFTLNNPEAAMSLVDEIDLVSDLHSRSRG